MDTVSRYQRAVRTTAVLVGALFIAGLACVIGPPPSASAMEIDCRYTAGLGSYIGSGRDGITCSAGTVLARTGDASSASPGRPTYSGPSTSGSGICDYYPPGLPDSFGPEWLWQTVDLGDIADPKGDIWWVKEYYDPHTGKLAGRYLRLVSSGGFSKGVFTDFTHRDASASIFITQRWSCDVDNWDRPTFVSTRFPGEPVLGMPPAPTAPTGLGLFGTSALAPVPGHPGQFLYRLDVKNSNTIGSQAIIDLDLSQFETLEDITIPTDWACTIANAVSEVCRIPSLAPGQSATLVRLVQLRPTTQTAAAIGVTFSGWFGHHTVGHWANDLDIPTGTRADVDLDPAH